MARVEIDPSWQEQVLAAWEEFGDERLGPDIADDARRYCPVDTGALKASIEHHMEGEDIIVSASGGGEDDDGNLFVYRRAGRLSETAAGRTHPNPGRNVGSLTTREVHHVAAIVRPIHGHLRFVGAELHADAVLGVLGEGGEREERGGNRIAVVGNKPASGNGP